MFDLLITGGTVADGTGRPVRRADVGVHGESIAAVGGLAGREAKRTLDASGMLVAPGFIDIHSHSDFTLLVDPRAQSQVFQGVTTEVIGNCGHGCAPITEPSLFTGNIYGYPVKGAGHSSPDADITWRTFAEYLERLEQARPAVNVAGLVPNGNLRLAVVGQAQRPATPDETSAMARLLEEGLEAGAWGYSTGLEYPAERAAGEAELVALCRVVARRGGVYAAHTRNREVHAVEAVEEAVDNARAAASRKHSAAAAIRLQVSHIIPRRGGPPDALDRCIEAVERARERGLDAAFDAHTRLYGITNLSNALPTWAFEGGPDALRKRLGDVAVRARMRQHESIISSFGLGGWDRVFLYTSPARPELAGKSVADLARNDGLLNMPEGADAWDAISEALRLHADEVHAPLAICLSYDETDVLRTIRHPLCTVGSDATALGVDGPLAGETFMGAFTWAGWLWRRAVVETRSLTVEEAVAKLTSRPAERLGLKGRGRLAEGMAADIAVFDPSGFRERGTLESPNQLAAGMRHVAVNGVVTLEDGRLTGQRGGRALRKG